MVTLGDAAYGGRIVPLDDAVLDNLQVDSHKFNVNGGRYEGAFSSVVPVKVEDLLDYYLGLGASEEDLIAFEESGVYQNLLGNSLGGDEVLVQWAEFPIGQPSIVISEPEGPAPVGEGGAYRYEISLASPSELGVAIDVRPTMNANEIDLGEGPGNPITLDFPAGDVGPRTVTVVAVEDDEQEHSEVAVLTHTVLSEDPGYADAELPPVPIGIEDNELGAWGYLAGDVNRDGKVDFRDVAVIADSWAGCTNPGDPSCYSIEPSPGEEIPGSGWSWWNWWAWKWCKGRCLRVRPGGTVKGVYKCKPDPANPCQSPCTCEPFRSEDGKDWERYKPNEKGYWEATSDYRWRCWCVK